MGTLILLLRKATDETAQVPESGGLRQWNETFPLSLASTFLPSILMHLRTGAPRLDDDLTNSQHHLLHFLNDP